jgi:hypothetical protein
LKNVKNQGLQEYVEAFESIIKTALA